MLNGTLVLYGTDIEKLAAKVIRDAGLRLDFHREEELLADLVATAWELSLSHDEARYPGKFGRGCERILRLRVIDWVRRTEGRTRWQFASHTYERERRDTLSLDVDEGSELGRIVESGGLDPLEVCNPALARALLRGSRITDEPAPDEQASARVAGRARKRVVEEVRHAA